jgi:hypothetical protein
MMILKLTLVFVLPELLNLVPLLELTLVMLVVINQLVSLVVSNVLLVKTETLMTVQLVLVTESTLQLVVAHLELMKTIPPLVHLVDLNVLPVPMLIILNVVILVLKEES